METPITCVQVNALASMSPGVPLSALPLPLVVPPSVLPDDVPEEDCSPLLDAPELPDPAPEVDVAPPVVPDDDEPPELVAPPLEAAPADAPLPPPGVPPEDPHPAKARTPHSEPATKAIPRVDIDHPLIWRFMLRTTYGPSRAISLPARSRAPTP
jgi:hypothetical protein